MAVGKVFRRCNHGDRISTCSHRPRCEYHDIDGTQQFGRWEENSLDDDARADRVKQDAYEHGFDHEELGR